VCSPFTTVVELAVVDAGKVQVSGVGVRREGVPASLPVSFKVDTSQAGHGNLDVLVKVVTYTSATALVNSTDTTLYSS